MRESIFCDACELDVAPDRGDDLRRQPFIHGDPAPIGCPHPYIDIDTSLVIGFDLKGINTPKDFMIPIAEIGEFSVKRGKIIQRLVDLGSLSPEKGHELRLGQHRHDSHVDRRVCPHRERKSRHLIGLPRPMEHSPFVDREYRMTTRRRDLWCEKVRGDTVVHIGGGRFSIVSCRRLARRTSATCGEQDGKINRGEWQLSVVHQHPPALVSASTAPSVRTNLSPTRRPHHQAIYFLMSIGPTRSILSGREITIASPCRAQRLGIWRPPKSSAE